MMKRFISILVMVFFIWAIASQPILAQPLTQTNMAKPNGAQIFETNCAGCHVNGGNIVRRGKDLKLKTLQRNGYATVDQIATLVTNGKGNMSAYRDRLTPAEIQTVSTYVLEQAKAGWKKG